MAGSVSSDNIGVHHAQSPGTGSEKHPPWQAPVRHYRRIEERPFTKDQKANTTILFGHLTPKHEVFIRSVFRGAGYRFQNLPQPTKSSFQTGKEYCNNGLCNPNYFTAGSLIEFLLGLEARGLSRSEIVDNYVYFTAGDCGPCRFGMYESEYRQALYNAGFEGFRVLTFRNNTVIREGTQQPGLQFNFDMGAGLLNAIILGDLLFDAAYRMRPFEVQEGATDKAVAECMNILSEFLQTRRHFEILEQTHPWLAGFLTKRQKLKNFLNSLGKYREHLYGAAYKAVLSECAAKLDEVELDRMRPKPVVKVVGEFYSHMSESEANYNMFSFLEKEGAQVSVDSITTLVLYWLHKARLNLIRRKGLDVPFPEADRWEWKKTIANQVSYLKKPVLFRLADRVYTRQYHRINSALGGIAHRLADQKQLSRLAEPFYNPLTRGGEGHLEVGKSIQCARQGLCHLVLSIKPFGCMPSTQSDGVMAAVSNRYDELLFLSVETSGDGDVNALSRVQMALADAKRKAKAEFEKALESAGLSQKDVRAIQRANPQLKRPTFRVPHHKGVAGVAANFVLHVANLLKRNRLRSP